MEVFEGTDLDALLEFAILVESLLEVLLNKYTLQTVLLLGELPLAE
jgi:hypothetical protein